MAVDMFLKIDDVKGESSDDAHKNEIDVISWAWGATQSGSAHMGGGAGAGKANVQDLSVTKYIDKSSPALIKLCCSGQHFRSAKLTVRKAGGAPLEYVIITLDEGLVASVSTGGTGERDRLTETVTLNFAKIKFEYTPQKADGSKEPSIPVTFDIATNKIS